MRNLRFTAMSILLALALAAGASAQDTTATTPPPLEQALARIGAAAQVRDSLSVLVDRATGEKDAVVEELLWQSQLDVQAGILDATTELEKLRSNGADLSGARAVLQGALASGWPRYRRQLERRERTLRDLAERRDAAPPAQRLDIETAFAEECGRIARMYRDLVDMILALEHVGITVTPMRTFVVERLSSLAEETRVRMVVLGRANRLAKARVQRKSDDATAQLELESSGAALSQSMQNLETEISLLQRMGKDARELKVALLVARGTLSSAIFEPGVIQGVFGHWRQQFVEMLVTRGPHWLFVIFMVVIILTGFGLLAKLVRRVVRRAVRPASFSQLLKDTIVDWSARLINLIGLLVLLRQFGVQLGPMLAGLGIAGFALGFALQDTLANFAAGAMILAYHPYDVGDTVEVPGANGVVKHMSLFSTTILTDDNQTLIVPNRKMWGDVIRNTTAQSTRRVDMVFSVDYANDVATVERLLGEVAQADARVLKEPAPVVKLDKLAESSVNYVVRVWTQKTNYWDVYWDITRAVKLRFDQEGVKFPQSAMRVSLVGDRPGTAPE